MEHTDIKISLDSKLQIGYKCSIRTRSRNWDMVEKLMQLILNPCVRHFKTTHLKEYPLFLDNEKLHDEKTNKWAKYLQTVMIVGVVTMIILPRISKRKN